VAQENAWKCLPETVWDISISFVSAISQQRPTMNVNVGVRRDDAMGTARGVSVHPAKALNRKNATAGRPDGSISIEISFGAYAIQSLNAVRSPLT